MFADNRKISLRQVRRLLILDIFGMSSLMLPGILASMTGADGLICLILGMAGGLVLLWLMGKNLQYVKENYYSYMKDTAGELVGDIFMVFYLWHAVLVFSLHSNIKFPVKGNLLKYERLLEEN